VWSNGFFLVGTTFRQRRYAAAYPAESGKTTPVKPLDDPDFIVMDAAIRRCSAKAIAKARAAGLEPIVSDGNLRIRPGGV
jgi:hypothetical protein